LQLLAHLLLAHLLHLVAAAVVTLAGVGVVAALAVVVVRVAVDAVELPTVHRMVQAEMENKAGAVVEKEGMLPPRPAVTTARVLPLYTI
jgi:hypothetical protein